MFTVDISFSSSVKSDKTPAVFFFNFTLPLSLRVSQSVHFVGSAGKRNLNGPLLPVDAIGLTTILLAFCMLFSISIPEKRSNDEVATSSLLIDNPPDP